MLQVWNPFKKSNKIVKKKSNKNKNKNKIKKLQTFTWFTAQQHKTSKSKTNPENKSHKISKNSKNSVSNQTPKKSHKKIKTRKTQKANRSNTKETKKAKDFSTRTHTKTENIRFFGLFKGASVAKMEEIIDPISINTNRTIRRWWQCWRIRIRMARDFAAISIHHLLLLLFCLCHSNWNGI